MLWDAKVWLWARRFGVLRKLFVVHREITWWVWGNEVKRLVVWWMSYLRCLCLPLEFVDSRIGECRIGNGLTRLDFPGTSEGAVDFPHLRLFSLWIWNVGFVIEVWW